ncbi:hypothetical protein [Planctomycetes bacterium Poly30]
MNRLTSRWIAAGALFAAAGLGGCDDPHAPKASSKSPSPIVRVAPGTYPDDVAFTIGGMPVHKSAIDEFVPLMKLIDPHLSEASHRRAALANVVLPMVAGAALDPEAREQAFQKAQRVLAAVRETGEFPEDAPEANYLTGTWKEVGLIPFKASMEMEPGTYSDLHESPAAWTFFKLIATNVEDGETFTPRTEITIQRYDIPYLPDEASQDLIQSAIDTLPVEIADEAWEHIIPPIVLYKPNPSQQ